MGSRHGRLVTHLAYWESFYAGNVIDRLQQGNERVGWSLFLDHHAILGFVKAEVLSSIKGQSGVTITRQPKAQWFDYAQIGAAKLSGYARIHVDLEVEKENACYCFTEDLNVTAEITADVYISVPKLDTVRIDLYSNVAPGFYDASCCILTAAAFWPILGFGQMTTGAVTGWEYMAGFLPFVSFIAAIVKVNDVHFDAKGKWIKDSDNEDHAYTEDHLFLPAIQTSANSRSRAPNRSMMAPRSRHSASSSGGVCRLPRRRSLSCRTHSLSPSAGTRQVAARNGSPPAADSQLYPDNPLHWALLHVWTPASSMTPTTSISWKCTRRSMVSTTSS